MSDVEEFFEHYGVPGMKWGVRRSDAQLARAAKGRRDTDSEDYTVSRQRKATPNRSLSTKELKGLNERLQLEKTNRELTASTAVEKIKRGTAVAGTVLAVGTTISTAYNLAKSPAGQAISKSIQNAFKN